MESNVREQFCSIMNQYKTDGLEKQIAIRKLFYLYKSLPEFLVPEINKESVQSLSIPPLETINHKKKNNKPQMNKEDVYYLFCEAMGGQLSSRQILDLTGWSKRIDKAITQLQEEGLIKRVSGSGIGTTYERI